MVDFEGLWLLVEEVFKDINYFLWFGYLEQFRKIFDDLEVIENDKFVVFDFLKNVNIVFYGVLLMCQDIGIVIVMGKKGCWVWIDGLDEVVFGEGVCDVYFCKNLCYLQFVLIFMFEEKNIKLNMFVQIEFYVEGEDVYKFLFMVKGGGLVNKIFLFQGMLLLFIYDCMIDFLKEKILIFGIVVCLFYYLVIVIGGIFVEMNLKMVKLVLVCYFDGLLIEGLEMGYVFCDLEMEVEIYKLIQVIGVGVQFGGKYFCYDVCVICLLCYGVLLLIGFVVFCLVDCQVVGKIIKDGIFLEQLEMYLEKYLFEIIDDYFGGDVVKIDLIRLMFEIFVEFFKYLIKICLFLIGLLIVVCDLVYFKLCDCLEVGELLLDYFKNYLIYYVGLVKILDGMLLGFFGLIMVGCMDVYVDQFQVVGGFMVMLVKGNCLLQVWCVCQVYGGFYFGFIGGLVVCFVQDCIKKVEVVEFEEFGMEVIWKIEVEDFLVFIVIDNKGNDFFKELNLG